MTSISTRAHPARPGALPEPGEAEIQKVAYRLWVEGGCLEGVELDNWFAAKDLLRHHHGRAGRRARPPVPETPRRGWTPFHH